MTVAVRAVVDFTVAVCALVHLTVAVYALIVRSRSHICNLTYEPLRCIISQYRRILFPSQCLCGTILLTLYSMVWAWWVLRAGPMLFYWSKLLNPFLSSIVFPFSSSFHFFAIVRKGSTDSVTIALSIDHGLSFPTFFINNNTH